MGTLQRMHQRCANVCATVVRLAVAVSARRKPIVFALGLLHHIGHARHLLCRRCRLIDAPAPRSRRQRRAPLGDTALQAAALVQHHAEHIHLHKCVALQPQRSATLRADCVQRFQLAWREAFSVLDAAQRRFWPLGAGVLRRQRLEAPPHRRLKLDECRREAAVYERQDAVPADEEADGVQQAAWRGGNQRLQVRGSRRLHPCRRFAPHHQRQHGCHAPLVASAPGPAAGWGHRLSRRKMRQTV
mmetsp:Transcript_14691/g.37747  ORF Transcript_14691/g.37747 Transcript_14691/m.37747 type:complete len:244 (-) Transcript_14691:179-910(-)